MVIRLFLAYVGAAALGLTGVYLGAKALLMGSGALLAWLGVLVGLPASAVGLLATGRMLYLVDRGRSGREER